MQAPGAYFLNVNVSKNSQSLSSANFFLDTGADVSVVSEFVAHQLGFDVATDKPDFTVAVLGSGGTTANVPGFYADQLTIPAIGGDITLSHVPLLALDMDKHAYAADYGTEVGKYVDSFMPTIRWTTPERLYREAIRV